MKGAAEGDQGSDATGLVGGEIRGDGGFIGFRVGFLRFAAHEQVRLVVEAGETWRPGFRTAPAATTTSAASAASSTAAAGHAEAALMVGELGE